MFGKIFNKLKKYGAQVDQLELTVSGERKKFLEVFERNIVLEKEITDRTEELSQANKSILTLQHIWSTMNSSEPLSEVLKTIIDGLTNDLGFLNCFILQLKDTENGQELKLRSSAENKYTNRINEILVDPLGSYTISFENDDNMMIQSIKTKQLLTTSKIEPIFTGSARNITSEKVAAINKLLSNRAISILPIVSQDKPFGCLVVISVRKEITDTEKNFLSLFAGQIEHAITIAGLFETIREQAITDGLTGLYNRRHFDQCIEAEADRAKRLKQPFSLITLDLDHLKFINDTYGHSAGDSAICLIADVLHKNARSIDIPSRFGGEEFGILLPGIDVEGGMIAAERLRSAIEESPVEGVGKVTASIGVATFLKHTDDSDELLELVDQAMYKAKRNGRNQVQIAQKDESIPWQQLALDTFIDILSKNRIPIEKNTATSLTNKIKSISPTAKNANELIYSVVDLFNKSYDPLAQTGVTKDKVRLATKLAKEVDLTEEEIDKIKMATLLYDVGNLMMPESILLKPGPLSEQEKDRVSQHPIIGAKEILSPISSASEILSLVEHHHESWDGSGYPSKLAGEDIPIGSRILIVVDTYFALINERAYRKAYSYQKALSILEESAGKTLDAKLVKLFTAIVREELKIS